jgi:hypothetical protein
MKIKKIIICAVITFALTSCMTNFYQIYKVVPVTKLSTTSNFLVYEDENCKVLYNLWAEGGNIGFEFYNKTNENIYINMEESFFVLNGKSYNYYQNRVFTNETGSTLKSGSYNNVFLNLLGVNKTNSISVEQKNKVISSRYAVSYAEEKIICVPPKTSKNISEYAINTSLFRNCDLLLYPSKREISTKKFKQSESPYAFSNLITYCVAQNNPIKFETEFYVSEISNYSEKKIVESKVEKNCGEKHHFKNYVKYNKETAPNKFYNMYLKTVND